MRVENTMLVLGIWLSVAQYAEAQSSWTLREHQTELTPNARNGVALVFDPDRNEIVLFGGHDGTFFRSDLWTFTCNWHSEGEPPIGPRAYSYVAYDSWRHQLLVFGGSGSNPSNSTLYIRDTNLAWTSHNDPAGPTGRTNGACVFDSLRGVMVIQGGSTTLNVITDETWEWDGVAWTLRTTGSPGARQGNRMVFDSWRGKSVLFGKSSGSVVPDTWEWDGTTWTLVATTGPRGQYAPGMAFDSRRGRTVLYGGVSFTGEGALAETWEWDGQSWTPVVDAGIQRRNGHSMAFDAGRTQAVFLFGGQGTTGNAQPISGLWYRRGSCIADFNRDGAVDFFDYLDFVDAFSSGMPLADINEDCDSDFFDYLDFVDNFSAGC